MLTPRVLLCATVFTSCAHTLQGQTLDIGGIELRLGQSSSSALSDLRVTYDVRYEEALQMWSVFRKRSPNDSYVWLGQLYVTDGVVARIAKDYDGSDPYELVDAYTLAMKELKRRGGTACVTFPREMTDGRFWGVGTRCGAYELSLNFPHRNTTLPAGADRVGAGLSVTVPRWPSP